jgi:hypothetical protein
MAQFGNPLKLLPSTIKLKSFEDMTQKTKLKYRSGDTVTVHVNPELVFRRALVLANCREDVTVEKVLSFPISSYSNIIVSRRWHNAQNQ